MSHTLLAHVLKYVHYLNQPMRELARYEANGYYVVMAAYVLSQRKVRFLAR